MRLALAVLLAACGGASVPAASLPAPSLPPPMRIYIVESFGDEHFVVLGGADLTEEPGRVIDDEYQLVMIGPLAGEVPALELVGMEATCAPRHAERVRLERRYSPDGSHSAAFAALRVEADCAPVLAVDRSGARMIPLLWWRRPTRGADGRDPGPADIIVGAGDGWRVTFDYPPSDDDTCPGSPAQIEVTGPRGIDARFEMHLVFTRALLLSTPDSAWLVVGNLTGHFAFPLLRGAPIPLGGFPTGIDLAEMCL